MRVQVERTSEALHEGLRAAADTGVPDRVTRLFAEQRITFEGLTNPTKHPSPAER